MFLKYMELRNVNGLHKCKHLVLTVEQQFVASCALSHSIYNLK